MDENLNCVDLAKRTRIFFEKNCKDLDLHFIRAFPHNSCETSSLILGKVILEIFPQKNVFFVAGTNSNKFERHFWVEVGESTFDITADQFDDIIDPIYGKIPAIISKRFDQIKKTPITEAIETNDFATSKTEEFNRIVYKILTST